jgi:hypothetical protein
MRTPDVADVRANPTLGVPPLSELPQYTPDNPLHSSNISSTPAQPSALAIPHFVDLSIVPKDSYCYRETVPFLGDKSKAKVVIDALETVTYDPICNTSEELWRYFLTYLTKPVLLLDLEVEHYEWHTGLILIHRGESNCANLFTQCTRLMVVADAIVDECMTSEQRWTLAVT